MQEQAYQSFNAQLLEEIHFRENSIGLEGLFQSFHSSGSIKHILLWQTLTYGIYGTDVLITLGNSFTGNVLKASYTEKMAGDMIMPNSLSAYSSKMSRSRTERTVKNFVEGYEGGYSV